MGILANLFTKLAKNTSSYCLFLFFEPEVPKSLKED